MHTFVATLKTAGSQSLTVSDTVTSTLAGTQSGILVNPAALSALGVIGFSSPTTAGVAHSFTVTARDAFGNTVTGYRGTVHFTSTDSQGVRCQAASATQATILWSFSPTIFLCNRS